MASGSSPPTRPAAGLGRARFALVLGAAVVVFAAALSLRHLGDDSLAADEATYARVVHETRAAGPLLPLRLFGRPYVNKPPAGFLLMRAAFAAAGESAAAARLPAALAGVATAALLALYGARRLAPHAGPLAAALYVTAPLALTHHALRGATFDALVALLVTGALVAHFESLEPGGERRFRIALAFVALATLVKTLAAAAFVAFAVLVVELVLGRLDGRRDGLGRGLRRALALLAAGAGALAGWIALLAALGVPDVLQRVVLEDLVLRHVAGLDPGHLQPATLYVERLGRDFGPWLVLLLPLAALVFRRTDDPEARARRRRLAALGVAALAMLALLHLSVSRVRWYVLPLYPALALALAGAAGELAASGPRWRRWTSALAVAALLVPRLDWAWRRTETPPRRTMLHRLQPLLASGEAGFWIHPDAPVHGGDLDGGPYLVDLAASNSYYLATMPNLRPGWPPAPASGECALALVPQGSALPEGAAGWPRHALPAREGPFALLDGCGGRVTRDLKE